MVTWSISTYLSGVILGMAGFELMGVLVLTGLSCGVQWPHLGHFT